MNIRIIIAGLLNHLFNDIISHIPVHFIRIRFIRLFNKRIHRSSKIMMHTRILCFWNLETARNVVINQFCLLDCRKYKIVIGENTDIGPYTHIWTLGHNPDDDQHALYGGPVLIGHHVWIASRVTILPGITLENGCVIGAASLVHKDVPQSTIVAGNPAKIIRKRENNLDYEIYYNPVFE